MANEGAEYKKERRNDVGLKMVYVILTAIITFLLSVTFFETYRKAEAAVSGLSESKKDIAVLQSAVVAINKSFDSVNSKLDLLLGWKK